MTRASMEADPIIDPTFEKFIINIKVLISTIKVSTLKTLLLKCMPYIYYLVQFKKNQAKVQIFPYFGSKINVINTIYTAKLGLKIETTNIET